MLILGGSCIVNIGLFACRYASIDLLNKSLLEKFEENQARARIKHLFDSGSIMFVLGATLSVVDMSTTR